MFQYVSISFCSILGGMVEDELVGAGRDSVAAVCRCDRVIAGAGEGRALSVQLCSEASIWHQLFNDAQGQQGKTERLMHVSDEATQPRLERIPWNALGPRLGGMQLVAYQPVLLVQLDLVNLKCAFSMVLCSFRENTREMAMKRIYEA
jgi:hypothetical protein